MAEGPEDPTVETPEPESAPQSIPLSRLGMRGRPNRSGIAEVAYPTPFLEEEEHLLEARRGVLEEERRWPLACKVGFGLSGGGIRSATFCLGFFQGLAAKGGLIRKIDYLSTVSGGGYFGSFLGRLFTRDYIRSPEDVESILSRDRTVDGNVHGVVRNLRELTRQVGGASSRDLALRASVSVRNWASVQGVLALTVLGGFLCLQLVRILLETLVPYWEAGREIAIEFFSFSALAVWWSPWGILALAIFLFQVVPLGLAYWLVPQASARSEEVSPRFSASNALVFLILLVLGVSLWFLRRLSGERPVSYGIGWLDSSPTWPSLIIAVLGLTLFWWFFASLRVWRLREHRSPWRVDETWVQLDPHQWPALQYNLVRAQLSGWLSFASVILGVLLVLTLVDSLGQTLYLLAHQGRQPTRAWVATLAVGMTGLFPLARFIRNIVRELFTSLEPIRSEVWFARKVLLVVIVTIGFAFTYLNTVSHAIAWSFESPRVDSRWLISEVGKNEGDNTRTEKPAVLSELPPGGAEGDDEIAVTNTDVLRSPQDLIPTFTTLVLLMIMSSFAARLWPVVNFSSRHPLHTSWLTRVYLGASNIARLVQIDRQS
ncbi:MAG TPA: hypothetical protein VNB06_19315, partial [Thermoanaerobaculia bacterium]|nr:hypothetical protein [Thermoanaerobaculia bacterium]